MVKKFAIGLMMVLLMAPIAGAVEVGGATLPDTVTLKGQELVLNGAGIREKYVIGVDVYAAGLYLKEKCTDADKIINANEPMLLKIKILTGLVSSEKFKEHTLKGFEESTGGNTAPIKDEINFFMKAFAKEINKGDLFDISYMPGQGIKVFKNNKPEPEVVVTEGGMTLKSALFGIWIGERTEKRPQELAADLLGK